MPVVVTVKAVLNRHWTVALFSLLSLTASVPQIVAGGIFVGTPNADGLVEHIDRGAFWFTFGVLILYLVCIPLARPTPAYRFPRCITSIAEVIQYCYASQIFEERLHGQPILSTQDATDQRIHLVSRVHLAKRNYQFGLYLGSDGRRHIGFDVAERQNSEGTLEYVDTIDPGRALYPMVELCQYWFRKPRIVRTNDSRDGN